MARLCWSVFLFVIVSTVICADSKAKESEESDEIDWQCGTDFISQMMSENQIEVDCPLLKVPINNCCLVHDDCYDKQLGRNFCDQNFCDCLQNATVSSAICHKEDGPLFCVLVKELGDDAYIAAGNVTVKVSNQTSASSQIVHPATGLVDDLHKINAGAPVDISANHPKQLAAVQKAPDAVFPLIGTAFASMGYGEVEHEPNFT